MYGNPAWEFPPTEWDRKTTADYILQESTHESVMRVRDRTMAGDMDDMPMTQVVAYARQKLEKDEALGWAKATAWLVHGVAWKNLTKVSQQELLEAARVSLANLA